MRKKQLLFLLLVISLCLSLHVTALAHPGMTDDDGGHTDSSTGEYHYHHGKPPHDHYDIDGDGIIDCPYNFDDTTNHGSDVSSSESHSNMSSVSNEITTLPLGLLIGLVVLISFSTLSDFLLHKLAGTRFMTAEIIEDISYNVRKRLYRQRRARLYRKYANKDFYTLSGAPAGAYLNHRGLPCTDDGKWFGRKYTFFVGFSTAVYHTYDCIHAENGLPINAISLPWNFKACEHCTIIRPNTRWIKKYKRICKLADTYNIPASRR